MSKLWNYLSNQFLNQTENSFKKATILSTYHDAALLAASVAHASLLPLYTRYHPLHQTLIADYNKWKSLGGSQEGDTLNVKQLLALSSPKLDAWEVVVLGFYIKTTVRYKQIFPNGRKPFNRGSVDDRINAFGTLSTNIGADANLAAVKTEVDAYYLQLTNARTEQDGGKQETREGSGEVDAARIAAMTMQYRNLGVCMDEFFDNTELTESLFDLETLRESTQVLFTGTLSPLETEPVLVHTFLPDDVLRLKSTLGGKVDFYLATTAGGTNSTLVSVPPLSELVITAADFGITDYGTHRYLTAMNTATDIETKFSVELE